MSKKQKDPVVQQVLDKFQQVYYQTLTFAKNPQSAINGLLVMGDAGSGKSHTVKQALRDAKVQNNVEYIKGGTITAPAMFVKLFLNRDPHRIVILDDIDILHNSEVRSKIIPMLLGSLEEGNNRTVTWSRASKNALMEQFDVPMTFEFNGKLILITNYVKKDIQEKLKSMTDAFATRFNDVECIFSREQKFSYTKYLIDKEDMLGSKCAVHSFSNKGKKYKGYPQPVIDETVKFLNKIYDNFENQHIVPRVAIKVADTIMYHRGHQQKIMLKGLVR